MLYKAITIFEFAQAFDNSETGDLFSGEALEYIYETLSTSDQDIEFNVREICDNFGEDFAYKIFEDRFKDNPKCIDEDDVLRLMQESGEYIGTTKVGRIVYFKKGC